MKTSESFASCAAALVAAQAEIKGGVAFDATNPFLKNKYASLGALIDATRPILAAHGLAIVQCPIAPTPGAIGVETVIVHQSGEWMASESALTVLEEKGKSTAQFAGSVITYLRRYAYAAALSLYGEEDNDGHMPERAPQQAARPAPRTNGAAQGNHNARRWEAPGGPALLATADEIANYEQRRQVAISLGLQPPGALKQGTPAAKLNGRLRLVNEAIAAQQEINRKSVPTLAPVAAVREPGEDLDEYFEEPDELQPA